MSWQGNECFVMGAEHGWSDGGADTDFEWSLMRQIEFTKCLLQMWECHGAGWYLLGSYDDDDPAYYDVFDYEEFKDSLETLGFCDAFLPNPIIDPGVCVYKVRKPSDVINIAYEMHESRREFVAYAGDGEMPFSHMVIYGEEYDFSKEVYEQAKQAAAKQKEVA